MGSKSINIVKIGKITGKVLLWIVGVFLFLDLLIVGLLFVKPIQNRVADFATRKVSEIWGCDLIIGEMYLTPTLDVKLYDCVLRDYRNNDMIRIGTCKTSLLHLQLKPTELYFGTFAIDDAEVVVRKYVGDEKVNIALWALNFKKKNKPKKLFVMHCDRVRLTNSEFRYVDDNKKRADSPESGIIDYGFFQLQELELDCKDFLVRSDDISAEISRLACAQYSGFRILNASGRFRINSHHLIFDNACIVTPHSRLFTDFAMLYDHWTFADFTNTVVINARIHPSKVGLEDVTCFAPKAAGMNDKLLLCGDVCGVINDLKTNDLYVNLGKNTFLKGDFSVKNITDISNVGLDLKFENSNICMADISNFNLPGNRKIALPAKLQALRQNRLTGTFKGSLDDFAADLALKTAAGGVNIKLDANSDEKNIMTCSGNIEIQNVNVSQFVNTNIVGTVSLTAGVSGTFASPLRRDDFAKTADVRLHSSVRHCYVKDYPLRDVSVNATYKNKKCDLTLLSADTNVRLSFDGGADFSGEVPSYEGELHIDRLAAGALFPQCKITDTASAKGFDKFVLFTQQHPDMNVYIGKLNANVSGNSLDNLSGLILLDSLLYEQDDRQLQTNSARLIAVTIDNTHKYKFTSDIVNASLSTNYNLSTVIDTLYDVAYNYFPNILKKRNTGNEKLKNVSEELADEEKYITIDIETFATRKFLSFFYPDLKIAPRTQLYFHQSSDTLKDSLYADCRFLELNNVLRVNNFGAAMSERGLNSMKVSLSADSISILGQKKNFVFSDIAVNTEIRKNAIDYDLRWRNPEIISPHPSYLAGILETQSKDHITNTFNNSELYIKEYLWKFNDENKITYNSGIIEVDNLQLKSAESSIRVDGKYSDKEVEPLVAAVDNLDMSILNSFIVSDNVKFDGALTAEFSLSRRRGKMLVTGKALANKFEFNDTQFGDINLFAVMPSVDRISFMGGIFDEGEGFTKENFSSFSFERFRTLLSRDEQLATLSGGYSPAKKEFSVKAAINNIDLGFLEPFLASFSHHISGKAGGELSFIYTPDSCYFDGTATVRWGKLGIKILNTIYSLYDQKISFDPQGITFSDVKAKDIYDNEATINGYIHHKLFKDMTMRIDISTDRILALNTPKTQDMPFYGDGFVGGDISIISDGQKMKFLSNNLVTQSGTDFKLPIYFSESTSESEVISFKKHIQDASESEEALSSELEFDFNFHVTPDAMVQLELDPSIGGLMKARVEGPFRLMFNNTSGLNINGELTIQSGTFRLTLKDIIDKVLTLNPGGTIRFLGPLDNATVNVSGIYKTTASLNEVIPEEMSGGSMRRTPVNAYMNLSGPLFNPSVDFSFELPNSTNEIATIFFSTLDTSGIANRTQQFFSLLVLGKFQNNTLTNTSSDVVASAVEYTGMELLTNTINNFISKNLKYVNVGINYRNADDSHAAEYSVSASTSFYNDRIVIEGSFGYANDKNKIYNNGNNFIGDYSIEYALNEQKNWRVKVFNVTNQYSSLTQSSPYSQGVALIYKQEFNNGQDWKDSWKRSKKSEKKKDKKEEKEKKKEKKKKDNKQ